MQRARDIENEGLPTDIHMGPPTNNHHSHLFTYDKESSADSQDPDDDSFGGFDGPGGDGDNANSSLEGATIHHLIPILTPTPCPIAVSTVPEGANVQPRRSG